MYAPSTRAPLLVLPQQALRWLASSSPREVLCSLPSETRHGAGFPPSITIFDALVVTSANISRTVQPRCSRSLTAPKSPPVWHENQKQTSSLPDFQPFPAVRGFLMEGDSVIWIREVWALQRNSKKTARGQLLRDSNSLGREWSRMGMEERKRHAGTKCCEAHGGWSLPEDTQCDWISAHGNNYRGFTLERKLSQERRKIPAPDTHLQRMSGIANLC